MPTVCFVNIMYRRYLYNITLENLCVLTRRSFEDKFRWYAVSDFVVGSDFYFVKRIGVQIVHHECGPVLRFEFLAFTRGWSGRPHRVNFIDLKRNGVRLNFGADKQREEDKRKR